MELHESSERDALDQLGDKVRRRLAWARIVEDLDDPWVVKARNGRCFPLEPAPCVRLVGKRLVEDLEGDVPAQCPVARSIHDAHSAAPELIEDFVSFKLGRTHEAIHLSGLCPGIGTTSLRKAEVEAFLSELQLS